MDNYSEKSLEEILTDILETFMRKYCTFVFQQKMIKESIKEFVRFPRKSPQYTCVRPYRGISESSSEELYARIPGKFSERNPFSSDFMEQFREKKNIWKRL